MKLWKGALVEIEGELQTRKYVSQTDHITKYMTEICLQEADERYITILDLKDKQSYQMPDFDLGDKDER